MTFAVAPVILGITSRTRTSLWVTFPTMFAFLISFGLPGFSLMWWSGLLHGFCFAPPQFALLTSSSTIGFLLDFLQQSLMVFGRSTLPDLFHSRIQCQL